MSATAIPQRDPEVTRIAQEVKSFKDELMGREGSPGRLTKLENEISLLRSQLSDTVRDAVADAMASVHARFDGVDRRFDKIDDPEKGNLAKIERRLGSVEGWRKRVTGIVTGVFAVVGALVTITGLVTGLLKLILKL